MSVAVMAGALGFAVLAALVPAQAAAAAPATAPAPADPLVVDRPRFEPIDGSPLGVTGVGSFRGAIEVVRSGAGLAVVNDVALDDYLRGIAEMPARWPLEAQKAQAIAARTYALYEMGLRTNTAHRAAGADICATQACQVYVGLAKEQSPAGAAWSAAVDQTQGQVLVYRGVPIAAKYSSSNGGRTVAGGRPYLRSADDPDDRQSPLHRWQPSYPLDEVVRVAGLSPSTTGLHRAGDDIVAIAPDAEGNPVEQRLAAMDFRTRLNGGLATPDGLPLPVPSIRFEVTTADGRVHFNGRGWGHGIGMSQYGALGKALRGQKAHDILAAYYAGLRPLTLPADRLPQYLKVAVALDRGAVAVGDGSGPFRIVDAAGQVVAHHATGTWSARPAGKGRVKLVPPPDQRAPPTASLMAIEPGTNGTRSPLTVKVSLDGPAGVTHISLARPDGAIVELDPPTVRAAGPMAVTVAPAHTATPGIYRIEVSRDAGGGRAAITGLPLDLSPGAVAALPPTVLAAASGTGDDAVAPRPLLDLLALILLGAVMLAAGGEIRIWVGRPPDLQLH